MQAEIVWMHLFTCEVSEDLQNALTSPALSLGRTGSHCCCRLLQLWLPGLRKEEQARGIWSPPSRPASCWVNHHQHDGAHREDGRQSAIFCHMLHACTQARFRNTQRLSTNPSKSQRFRVGNGFGLPQMNLWQSWHTCLCLCFVKAAEAAIFTSSHSGDRWHKAPFWVDETGRETRLKTFWTFCAECLYTCLLTCLWPCSELPASPTVPTSCAATSLTHCAQLRIQTPAGWKHSSVGGNFMSGGL